MTEELVFLQKKKKTYTPSLQESLFLEAWLKQNYQVGNAFTCLNLQNSFKIWLSYSVNPIKKEKHPGMIRYFALTFFF